MYRIFIVLLLSKTDAFVAPTRRDFFKNKHLDSKYEKTPNNFIMGEKGLLYHDTVIGTGDSPSHGDELEVHYKGWYYSPNATMGIKFDDSKSRDKNKGLLFEYGKSPIIEGWKIGLKTMKAGGKRIIILPPSLGYGNKAVHSIGRPSIPSNSELRFEIELVVVNNNIIRKLRRNIYDFIRPSGFDYI
jgi:peptidylprolyl isomerase